MWRNIEVFVGSGPTRIGSELSSGDGGSGSGPTRIGSEPSSGDGGSGSGKGSPYSCPSGIIINYSLRMLP